MPGFSHLIAACLHLSPTTCLHALSITPLPIIYPFSLNALYYMRFACFSKYADFPQVLEVPLVHKHSNLLTIYAHSGGVSCDLLLSLDETTPLMLPYSQGEKTNDTSLQRHDACIDPITSASHPTGHAYVLAHNNTPNDLYLFCHKGLSNTARVYAMDDKVLYTPDIQQVHF